MKLKFNKDLNLLLLEDNPVILKKCFPFSSPHRFFSLRDLEDKEISFIDDLNQLDETASKACQDSFQKKEEYFKISKIYRIYEEFDMRVFAVETQFGKRIFQTHEEDWPKEFEDGRILISDYYGDHYFISSLQELSVGDREKILYLLTSE